MQNTLSRSVKESQVASNETYKETRYCKKCDKETVQMYENEDIDPETDR